MTISQSGALEIVTAADAAHKRLTNAAHIERQSGELGKEARGRRQAGSAWLRPKSHRLNVDTPVHPPVSQSEEPKNVAHLHSTRTHFDALSDLVRVKHQLWST